MISFFKVHYFIKKNPSRCFAGFGSGTWATVCFAVGRGVPVVVFGISADQLPLWDLVGRWECIEVAGVQGFFFSF